MFKNVLPIAALCCFAGALPASAQTRCDTYNNHHICVTVGGSVDHVQIAGEIRGTFNITCTDSQWILHRGWQANINLAQAREFADNYCQGRGSMF